MVCSRNVALLSWKPVDSRSDPDFVVAPDERLSWPRTVGLGAQHVVAMFGATFLVPVLTGFPPATTLLFSGVGTVLFLLITGNRLPSYLGSSFSVIAPVTAAVAAQGTGSALGGIVAVGLLLIIIGGVVHFAGTRWLDLTLPPVVTGAVVALIGFNLAPAAKSNFEKEPLLGFVTLVLLVAVLAFFRGMIGRLAIFLAVAAGYDAQDPVGLSLLPIDTRLEAASLAEFRLQPQAWTHIALDLSNPDGMAQALGEVVRTRLVSQEEAQLLGFWDDERVEDNPPLQDGDKVEVVTAIGGG